MTALLLLSLLPLFSHLARGRYIHSSQAILSIDYLYNIFTIVEILLYSSFLLILSLLYVFSPFARGRYIYSTQAILCIYFLLHKPSLLDIFIYFSLLLVFLLHALTHPAGGRDILMKSSQHTFYLLYLRIFTILAINLIILFLI